MRVAVVLAMKNSEQTVLSPQMTDDKAQESVKYVHENIRTEGVSTLDLGWGTFLRGHVVGAYLTP